MIYLNIRQKLIFSHIAIVVLLIVGMGVSSYRSQVKILTDSSKQYHSDISQRFIGDLSLAMAGNNYGNVTLPVFTKELLNLNTLLYLELDGFSDNNNRFHIIYDKQDGLVRRAFYPPGYAEDLKSKIEKFKAVLGSPTNTDQVKIQFILNRAEDELQQYQTNLKSFSKNQNSRAKIAKQEPSHIDTEAWTLKLQSPTANLHGGELTLLFDTSKLKSIRLEMINNALLESCLALILGLPLMWLVGVTIVEPIEALTDYISNDLKSIKPENIPAKERADEVGYLANKFHMLISQTNEYIDTIEQSSITDSLTGLYNRRYYFQKVKPLLEQTHNSSRVISFIYIDIDNFKKYNDNYGHGSGDEALKDVAHTLKSTLRRSHDLCFRFGGEEFLVIVVTDSADASFMIAEKIRHNIENLNIEHVHNDDYGRVTISSGICSVTPSKENQRKYDEDKILHIADEQLYIAKHDGRNRVEHRIL